MKVGFLGLGIFGMIMHGLGLIIELIVAMIVYLGLYIPMLYMCVVFGLWLWGGFEFVPSAELTLFYVGLAISLICSVALTLRHLIFEPFGRYLDRRDEARAERRARENAKRAKRRDKEMRRAARDRGYVERREPRYSDRREPRPPYRDRNIHERPMVYRSHRDGSIIIYEFSDRFEVYREEGRGLRHIDTKRKR